MKRFRVVMLMVAAVALVLCAGCQQLGEKWGEAKSEMRRTNTDYKARQAAEEEPAAAVAEDLLVTVTMDGQKAVPGVMDGISVVGEPVDNDPRVVFTMDPAMGEFTSCIVNVYKAANNEAQGKPWALTEVNPEKLVPGNKFDLSDPGQGVTILTPDGKKADELMLLPGEYIGVFAVTGRKQAATERVFFVVE